MAHTAAPPANCCGHAGGSDGGASQRSLHNAPIFRLLLKVAVKGTHQCDLLNFCGGFWSPTSVWYWSCCWLLLAKLPRQHGIHMATRMAASATARAEARTIHTRIFKHYAGAVVSDPTFKLGCACCLCICLDCNNCIYCYCTEDRLLLAAGSLIRTGC